MISDDHLARVCQILKYYRKNRPNFYPPTNTGPCHLESRLSCLSDLQGGLGCVKVLAYRNTVHSGIGLRDLCSKVRLSCKGIKDRTALEPKVNQENEQHYFSRFLVSTRNREVSCGAEVISDQLSPHFGF